MAAPRFRAHSPSLNPNPKADIPIAGKARAKSIGARTADPIASDIRRVVPTRAIDHNVVRADLGAKVNQEL